MKRAILFAMIGFLILGWCMTGKDLVEKPAYFHKLISEAEKYESEKIYVRAIKSYKEALTYQPNSVEIKTKIAVDYLALGDESSFINRCNSINEEHGYPVSVATLLTDYFIEKGRNEKAIAVLQPAMKKHKNNEELLQRYEKIKYTYADMYLSYDQILPFRNDSAVYIHNGKYGLIDAKGKTKVREKNEWMGALSSGRDAAPACLDGEFFYVDDNGYRIEVPRQDQQVEELGVLCNDAAPAKINGKYGYVNVKFEEQSPFEWDDATVIQTGFGAVCKGEKWALLDKSYHLITDYIYDDVKTDAYGYCSISGRAFVKSGNAYRMVNEKGETVGELLFQDAVPFVSEEPTAVQIGDKWGFVSLDGQLVIEPQYENAGAFANGLAPVETLSGWGYINQSNELVIEDEYTEACSFYKGIAPVKKGNRWTVISLNVK